MVALYTHLYTFISDPINYVAEGCGDILGLVRGFRTSGFADLIPDGGESWMTRPCLGWLPNPPSFSMLRSSTQLAQRDCHNYPKVSSNPQRSGERQSSTFVFSKDRIRTYEFTTTSDQKLKSQFPRELISKGINQPTQYRLGIGHIHIYT